MICLLHSALSPVLSLISLILASISHVIEAWLGQGPAFPLVGSQLYYPGDTNTGIMLVSIQGLHALKHLPLLHS